MKQSILCLILLLATFLLTATSCSKKSVEIAERETATQKFYYGGIYNACDFDPQIFMNIDTLKKYCSKDNRLDDLLEMDSISQASFTSALFCQPATILDDGPITNSNPTSNEINWDFKISMGLDGYQLEWRETPLSIKPVEVETGFQERGKYPFTQFYKGYEVKTSDMQTVTVLFFNAWIGGCLHDYYVWELVEKV